MDEVFENGLLDSCERACELALDDDPHGLSITQLHTCDLVVDEDYVAADPQESADTASDGEVVGSVQCSGVAAETCLGRRPLAHTSVLASNGEPLRAMAVLEHASIAAFHELRVQLARFGASDALLERCLRAARDEEIHTELVCGLGGIDPSTLPAAAAARIHATPFEVAAHNALEGCVNECWAALLAGWQSLHAERPEVRDVFRRIAADEAGHGQLAWDIHRWFLATLPTDQCDALVRLQRDALERLVGGVTDPSVGWPAQLGFPTGPTASRLANTFAAGLRAAA